MLRGWIRTSLIDFPDHIATVLFTGGCNFRCPMCHNADLVLRPSQAPAVEPRDVWDFLARRRGMIDGIVLTGGEPTMHPELIPILQQARDRGLRVKLDTNGYLPDVLSELIAGKLVDYVAMDVKAPPEKYAQLAGVPGLDVTRIKASMAALRLSNIAYEFRTTVAPGLLDEEDITRIARWIAGAPTYALQQFRPQGTLDPALENGAPLSHGSLSKDGRRRRSVGRCGHRSGNLEQRRQKRRGNHFPAWLLLHTPLCVRSLLLWTVEGYIGDDATRYVGAIDDQSAGRNELVPPRHPPA